MPILPFGSWPSPITADLVVANAVSIGELGIGTSDVWWSELRPDEGGRVVVVRHRPGGQDLDTVPATFSVRTRVHEYGGGAWWLHDDSLFAVNWSDQRIYRIDADSVPMVLTPEPEHPSGARYADGRVTADGRWVVCVRELHGDEGAEPRNEIVAIDAHVGGDPQVLVTGPDFVSFPRPSPDGRHLCWTQWNHPLMPWDGTELWCAALIDDADRITLDSPRRLAGGEDESIFQPTWAADGGVLFVSDRSDWWNLYRIGADRLDDPAPGSGVELVGRVDGEIGVPQWVFDQSRYAELADGRIVCAFMRDGLDHLGVIEPGGGEVVELRTPYTSFASVQRFGDGAALVAASPTSESVVAIVDVSHDLSESTLAVIRPARDLGLDPRVLARPEPISFTTGGGSERAHALFYPPTNPEADGPDDERPPLVVLSHGGPTSAARPQLNLAVQYFTSRGFAVVDVNYRGSTGYGRRFRRALDDAWGIADVDDCIGAAMHLVERGDADVDRLAIRGGSAGGYTTLCALTFHDLFTVGATLYGVADLEALARDTHKFESRYLDGLVGAYPERQDVYVERSPIHHTDRLQCPLIIFQGLEDVIVPPSQAEMMVEALRRKGLPFAYLAFEGEQHGFRQAANIKRVVEAELSFYARIFGIDLSAPVPEVPIENL
jgi:dipeptidyl aminopeptidase/acylaminoacyl peptidase